MFRHVPLCKFPWFTRGMVFRILANMFHPMRKHLVHLTGITSLRIPKHVTTTLCVWFTSGTSFVYPNMYPLCVWFTSDTSRIQIWTPYAFGSPQVPLSYTQICTPYAFGSPHEPLSYTQICTPYAFGSPQVPLSYTQICTPYAFGSPQVPLSYTQICTPYTFGKVR